MDSKPIEFVSSAPPGTNKEEKQQSFVPRAHAAKGEPWRRKSEEAGRRSLYKTEQDTAAGRWQETGPHHPPMVDTQRGLDADDSSQTKVHLRISQHTCVRFVPRTISPTFGATSFNTFDASHDSLSSQKCVMLSTTVWPSAVGQAVAKAWFEDFCSSPVLYHAHCMAATAYRDLLSKCFLCSGGKFMLFHKASAISLIREQIERLESTSAQDIERLIFSMMILSGHRMESRLMDEMDLPFEAHIPTANMLRLWGRFEAQVAHQNAAFALTNRQGGLHKLRTPGLSPTIALVDVLRAGSYQRKPVFPCYWSTHVVDVLPEDIDVEVFLTSDRRPGIGFFKLPGGLPHSAASVFAEIACLDRIMSTFQGHTPTDAELVTLLDARCATLHRLFSLPAWDELTSEGQEKPHRAIYEVCRITAIIYCNAIILPIPLHNGWNDRCTAMLAELLTTADVEKRSADVSGLHVWALLIGGVAAQGTAQRPLFEVALKQWYATHPQSWSAIIAGLKEFVWSDHACKVAGAALLHRALFGADGKDSV